MRLIPAASLPAWRAGRDYGVGTAAGRGGDFLPSQAAAHGPAYRRSGAGAGR